MRAAFVLRVVAAGMLLSAAVLLIVIGVATEWDCSTGGPHSWLAAGAGLLSACALLVLLWSRKHRWWFAVSGGLLVFLPIAAYYTLLASGTCAN
ncbi:MAG: hypothetical protein M3546_04660 [Actinomycetota bacterium]|nr:hypothetical protein [Actinomycetota bacterium]